VLESPDNPQQSSLKGEPRMARLIALALLAYCSLQSGFARADDIPKQLIGSWKLSSWVIQIIGGDLTEPFGANPKGRAVFTPDGHVVFVVVAANRKQATNDEEFFCYTRVILFRVFTQLCQLSPIADAPWIGLGPGSANCRREQMQRTLCVVADCLVCTGEGWQRPFEDRPVSGFAELTILA
jgi:hypothetical protein